ncbi:MAG: hypothetical protein QW821_00690 [Candidatus Bathyarchaeia archaeon]
MVDIAVAAIVGKNIALKRIENKLRKKGAISEKSRVDPKEAGLTKRELGWIERLVEEGKLGKAEDGKIWWKE